MIRHVPNYDWQVVAVQHVERLLNTVSRVLDEASIPYAVIGGNAVAVWVARRDVGAVRATKDVDILLRREDIDRAAAALVPHGFVADVVLGVPVFMEASAPLPSQGVHVIVARERVRPDAKHAAPDVDRVARTPAGFLVLELAPLVAMKLDSFRRVDQVHIEDLLRIGLIDATLAEELPDDLLERLRHVRDTMEWNTKPPEF